jgi:ADP-heptose:LPS heptosyltransferase
VSPRNILVVRFSAMGDVMLLVPVLDALTRAYPQLNVTLVTRPRFTSFFKGVDRLQIFEADVDHNYRGLLGMPALFKALLQKGDYDIVFDLHDHLRTMILRSFFRAYGKKVVVFKKGRKEKNAFVRKQHKVTRALPHTVDRYREAFERAGFDFKILPGPFLHPEDDSIIFINNWIASLKIQKTEKWIGIAPFAMHLTKVWPKENYIPLMTLIAKRIPVHFFFFGGGESEIIFFESLKEKFGDKCTIVAGQIKIQQEIALLPHLDLMLCVDSSNMHMAALAGIPLLSLWGGTHPDVGFNPYRYDSSSILQISRDELPCRPCSVYGKDHCFRNDFACLNWITPELVSARVLKEIGY